MLPDFVVRVEKGRLGPKRLEIIYHKTDLDLLFTKKGVSFTSILTA